MMDVVSVAIELYLLPPAEFTAARNKRAKEAGDRALTAEVRALPKPSASAWAVTQLVHADPDTKTRFEQLGAALRDAQADADRTELTRLVAERRSLVRDSVREAKSLASRNGVHLSPAAVDEIEQSLQAALAAESGFAAVFSGRLVRPIRSDGLEPPDLSGAIGGPGLPAQSPGPRRSAPKSSARTAVASKKREAAIERARREAKDADAEARAVEDSIAGIDAEREDVAEELESLRAQLDDRTTRQKALEGESKRLVRERARLREAARRAHRALDVAERDGR